MYPDLIDNAQIRAESVGQALRHVRVVLAPARPVGWTVNHHLPWIECVLHPLGRETICARGTDAVQDAVHEGLGGDEGASEVGVYPVVLLGVMAGPGAGRRERWDRRRFAHLNRAGEAGDLGEYPQAEALAEFVGDNELTPGAGDGGGAGEIGGVVEAVEDAGGCIGA